MNRGRSTRSLVKIQNRYPQKYILLFKKHYLCCTPIHNTVVLIMVKVSYLVLLEVMSLVLWCPWSCDSP